MILWNILLLLNKDVRIEAKAYDAFNNDITESMPASYHIFEENGSYTFTITDKWGNTTTRTVHINHIDKVKPTISIEQQIPGLTNQDYDLMVDFKDMNPEKFNSGIKSITLPNR